MFIRRKRRVHLIQGIEIIPCEAMSQHEVKAPLSRNEAIKIQYVDTDKGDVLYEVELPEGLCVKPADLRYLAYDHEEVAKLVEQCVSDNMQSFRFQPLDATFFEKVKTTLGQALQDLVSVMDLVSVECRTQEGPPDEYTIEVVYEQKNGERQVVCIQFIQD